MRRAHAASHVRRTRPAWPFVRGVEGRGHVLVRRSCRIVWAHNADRYMPRLSVSTAVTRSPRVAYHETARTRKALVVGARSSGSISAETTRLFASIATWTYFQPRTRTRRRRVAGSPDRGIAGSPDRRGRDERRESL